MPTICLIGLGYIGLPTAVIFASKGYKVIGVDLNKSVVEKVNKGKSHINEPNLNSYLEKALENKQLFAQENPTFADIYIIAVPTPHYLGENNFYYPDTSIVFQAVEQICPYIKKENLIILESTSPIGTTEKIENLIKQKTGFDKKDIDIAYCPERVLPGNIFNELKNNDRIVGGLTDNASIKAKNLYSKICEGKIFPTNSRIAEMSKLCENAYRDINIAYANELSMICDQINIDVKELINLSNKHPRVNILNPGCGVGGHCIAVDPWFIASQFPNQSSLIQTARNVNMKKTRWVINKIKLICKDYIEKFGNKPKMGFLGLAFKPDVDDLRESPALKIVQEMILENHDIIVAEPNVKDHKNIKLHKYSDVVDDADLIFILVGHKEFKFLKPTNKKIFDFSSR